MDCRHQRDSIFGRMLRSCRECDYERDPALMDRAVRTFARVEMVRAGVMEADDALSEIQADYQG